MDRHWQQAEEGLVPLCLVAASKSGEASPRHRRTLDNPLVQMDVKQSHSVDGHGASPRQRQIKGKPTVQTRGIPTAQKDVGHAHDTDGCRASPWRKQMLGIPAAGRQAQGRRVSRARVSHRTARLRQGVAAPKARLGRLPAPRLPRHTAAACCQCGACESAVMDHYNSHATI